MAARRGLAESGVSLQLIDPWQTNLRIEIGAVQRTFCHPGAGISTARDFALFPGLD